MFISIGFMIFDSVGSNKIRFERVNGNQKIGKSVSIHNKKYSIEYPYIGNKRIDKKIKKIINNYVDEFLKSKYYSYINYESYLGIDNNISIVFIKTIEKKKMVEEVQAYNFNLASGEQLKDSYIFVGDYSSVINKYIRENIPNNNKFKDICDISKITDNYKVKYALTQKYLKIYFNRDEVCNKDEGVISFNIPYKNIESILNVRTNKTTKKNITTKMKTSKYEDVDKFMYLKTLSNMYVKDKQNGKLIQTINTGSKVYVLKKNHKWSKVKYHKKYGYINNNNLSKKMIIYDGYNKMDEKVYALSNLEARKYDDINSEVLYNIEKKEEIKRIGVNENGWSQLLYKNDIVFIYSSYLTTNKEDLDKKEAEVKEIDSNKPMVALTFDDGPSPTTNRILDVLQANGAVATFFELGSLMNNYPDIIRREEEIGCEVASHTFSHANLNKMSVNEIQTEVANSEDVFMNILGHKPTLVRPPYGNANDLVKANIPYPLINWNVDTLDWKYKNKDTILSRIREVGNYDGRIILMHSLYQSTADAVEVIVPEMISQGYQLVTVSQLAQAKGVTLSAGNVYYSFNQ